MKYTHEQISNIANIARRLGLNGDVIPSLIGDPDIECKRIEIPRQLANYIRGLQEKIRKLEMEKRHEP